MEKERTDSVLIIVFGRLNFSCLHKVHPPLSLRYGADVKLALEILRYAVGTEESHEVKGAVSGKSTTISAFFRVLSSKLLSPEQVTRWSVSHLNVDSSPLEVSPPRAVSSESEFIYCHTCYTSRNLPWFLVQYMK